MTAPLSAELRERIVSAIEAGSSARAVADQFGVSSSAVNKLMRRVRATGSIAPAKIGGHRRRMLEPHAEAVRAVATSRPGITLKEIRAALNEQGIDVKALSTVAGMLHRLGLPQRKEREAG